MLAAAPAFAQDSGGSTSIDTMAPDARTKDRVTVGVGAGVTPTYEGSDEYMLVPVPLALGRVSGIGFQLRGTRLLVDVIPGPGESGWDVVAGPAIGVNFNRTREDLKDDRVSALGKIDTAIEAGGWVGFSKTGLITSEFDNLSVTVAYLHDVGSVHKSYVISPEIAYGTPLSTKTYVGISASAEYVGDGYARTYFGVTPGGAAASGLPGYDLDGGWKSWTVGLLGDMALTGDLTGGLQLVATASYRKLLGDFADSPIVSVAGSRDQWFGAIGLAYTF